MDQSHQRQSLWPTIECVCVVSIGQWQMKTQFDSEKEVHFKR